MVNNRKDQAVSEVMGTILMVALVVILAAIIGSMVFGLAGSVQNTNLVGVSAVKADNVTILVTFTSSGDNAVPLYWLNVSVNGNNAGALGTFQGTTPLGVGNSSYFSGATTGSDHVVITGTFGDGTQQVVMDTNL